MTYLIWPSLQWCSVLCCLASEWKFEVFPKCGAHEVEKCSALIVARSVIALLKD
jgi:hypothetical protein